MEIPQSNTAGRFTGDHHELTERVIGVFYDVANELGIGFLESIYRRAMVVALREAGLKVEEELAIPVSFRGVLLGTYFADIVVDGVLILELKVGEEITKAFLAQALIIFGLQGWKSDWCWYLVSGQGSNE